MWNLSAPWWEFVLRGLIVYGAVLALLRLSGKRQIGQLTPFDLVLLLVLSNAVQNAMNAGDNSVTAGLILAVTLVAANAGLGYLTWRSRRLEVLVEGRPQFLIHDGKVLRDVMRSQRISFDDLNKVLRHAGCSNVADVHFAILETDGTVSVKARQPPAETAPARSAASVWSEVGKDDAV
ncbi:hypothetical protein LMG23992_02611 [Cupriavidus laharis]|uniref:YetF C-terminal domain-containing protein n=1 Tax=Cupriavidus laharis TaxID=151654 RepID=A0ABM8X2D6_9BURK|nr:YetF domain-containing protein [Cupriavidus laharis]CAG9174051.1 hypothetical protein LMG23992_02611 [Cupriavidus laharis]